MSGLSWVNALALGGIALVAPPILIHMLGRAPAKTRRFPTLRFLEATRLMPASRTRLQDILLLILRSAAIAAGAVALAGPVLSDNGRNQSAGARAVAIIVDTSASVPRAGVSDSVSRVLSGAARSITLETLSPGRAVAGAGAWLASQPGHREIVIFSDFQLGAVDSSDLHGLPAGTTVSFARLAGRPGSPTAGYRVAQGDQNLNAQVRRSGDAVEVSWTSLGASAPPRVELLGTEAERVEGSIAGMAARTVGRPVRDSAAARRIAIVFARYSGRAELIRGALAVTLRGDADLIARLATDSLLAAAVGEGVSVGDSVGAPATVIARAHDGKPLLAVAHGGDRLLFFVNVAPATPTSAALQAAIARNRTGRFDLAELEARTLTDEQLGSLARSHAPTAAEAREPERPAESGASRWLWIAALILLAIEWLVRTRATAALPSGVANVRG